MRLPKLLVLAVLGVAVLVTAATFVYIHFIEGDAPPKLTLQSTKAAPASGATVGTVDGTWQASTGSLVGYRVKEVLFGQSATAYGRTSAVTGSFVIAGTTIPSATVTVDMTKVASDQAQRDGQFQGRIMNTATYPTATFELTKPIALGTLPTSGQPITASATGRLTLHGTTKDVTFPLSARINGANIEVNGSIPVTFADYQIRNPSGGPATTEDHGVLEFLVAFTR